MSYMNNLGYKVPVPTPERHYATQAFNVYFRENGKLGQVLAEKCWNVADALRNVARDLKAEKINGPFLALIQGGKK